MFYSKRSWVLKIHKNIKTTGKYTPLHINFCKFVYSTYLVLYIYNRKFEFITVHLFVPPTQIDKIRIVGISKTQQFGINPDERNLSNQSFRFLQIKCIKN